jgi:hypothetical protein
MGGGLKPDIVLDVQRYDLWFIPSLPIDVPFVRPRTEAHEWRVNLLESIRQEGLRYPIVVYGHFPKGNFNPKWAEANKGRDPRMYIAFGTNRYWALKQLEADSFPAILSWNKGKTPPFDGEKISPHEFRNYAPAGRIFVQEHGFGYKVEAFPEDEFKS